MDRQALLRAAELADTAALYSRITASHSNINPEMAERYAREVEDTLYQALDALAEAQRMPAPRPFLAVAQDIVNPFGKAA